MIENGEMLFGGVVERKTVGASGSLLIYIAFQEKGPVVSGQLFAGIVNFWLLRNGFSSTASASVLTTPSRIHYLNYCQENS